MVVLAAILSAAAACPAAPVPLELFSEPQGWFTIAFPRTWTVKSRELNGREVRNGVLETGRLSIVHARAEDEPTYVDVFAGLLREPISSLQFAASSSIVPEAGETMTEVQWGLTRIDGREAYYRYFNVDRTNGENSFAMFVYVVAGRGGFQLTAETPRDETYRQRSVPLLQQILQSFHAGAISLPSR